MPETKEAGRRDLSIDVLRWLALTGIVLVHIQPSTFWSQLRSFDVPMMVFLSAYCFAKSSHGMDDYMSYCIKRFKRLVLPCWIFLIVWFGFKYCVLGESPDWYNVIMCFTLLTPWYLWIIRVFVCMALIAPIATKHIFKLSSRSFYTLMIIGLIFNEFLCGANHSYSYTILVMTFSYFLVFAYGTYIKNISNKQILIIGGGTAIIFILMAIMMCHEQGNFVPVGKYKFPPHLYYLSYAFMCLSFLWLVRQQLLGLLQKIRLDGFAAYIGSHTLWIYLWHIPMVTFLGENLNAPIRFIIVYFSAISLAFLQERMVLRFCRHLTNEKLKKNVKSVLIG